MSGGAVASTALDLPWQELQGRLRAFIGRRVRNAADVDDLVQRVLLRIVSRAGDLRRAERVHAWMYRIARNAIADHYRSPTARREQASGGILEIAAATAPGIPAPTGGDDRAALRELAACLPPMIGRLPPRYREAIRMAELEGVTQADAARHAGVSLSGMKSRVQRARLQLRALVEECCRVDLDRRGSITAFASRHPARCGCGRG
jgi:RNA polymerase sigma-70 factor (ECF subfamily)